jgi:drug/metabolite transporter (DMT)-like permease
MRIVVSIIFVTLIWGYAWTTIKIGLHDIPPTLFASLRLFIGAIPLFLLQWIRKKPAIPRHKKDWKNIGIMSALMSLGFMGLVTFGMQFVDSGQTSVLAYTMPIFVTVFAHFLLKERLTGFKLFGLFIGLLGILAILGPQLFTFELHRFIGQMLIVLSAISWAAANIFSKIKFANYDLILMNAWQILLGSIVLFVISLFTESYDSIHWSFSSVSALLFTGILGTSFTFVAWFWLLGQIEASTASITLMAVPILGLFFGWLQLHETITTSMFIGALFVCLGIFFGAYKPKKMKQVVNH